MRKFGATARRFFVAVSQLPGEMGNARMKYGAGLTHTIAMAAGKGAKTTVATPM